MGEKALNRARENEVDDSAGGCVCPQMRAHSRYLAFRQDYVFSVRRVSLAAEQVSCATTFQMVSFPGSSWATNGHYPARVSPGVVPSRVDLFELWKFLGVLSSGWIRGEIGLLDKWIPGACFDGNGTRVTVLSFIMKKNQLFGEIPMELAGLTLLSVLDLWSKLCQALNSKASMSLIMLRNDKLSGLPLPSKCPKDKMNLLHPPAWHGKYENNEEDEESCRADGDMPISNSCKG
ncbi:hypothetical protein LguiA_029702 [Lonicera macranthoides]